MLDMRIQGKHIVAIFIMFVISKKTICNRGQKVYFLSCFSPRPEKNKTSG